MLLLTFGCLSCGNDTHGFTALALLIGMRNKQHHGSANHAKRLPALLAVLVPILNADLVRVVENELSEFEAHSVFCLVALILCSSQSIRILNCSYIFVVIQVTVAIREPHFPCWLTHRCAHRQFLFSVLI